MNINKAGYYKWLQKINMGPKWIGYEMEIKNQMQKIAVEFPRYGYRRMTMELHNRGYSVNHKRVLRLM